MLVFNPVDLQEKEGIRLEGLNTLKSPGGDYMAFKDSAVTSVSSCNKLHSIVTLSTGLEFSINTPPRVATARFLYPAEALAGTGNETKDAEFSDCGQYRYSLCRIWDKKRPLVLFVGFNPSTADAEADDKTVCRCRGFAKAWGYGGFYIVNLFAVCATDPDEAMKAGNPLGPLNDEKIAETIKTADLIVAAWGDLGGHKVRPDEVLKILSGRNVWCLGQTKKKFPRHPLYIKGDTLPELYRKRVIK